MAAPPGKRRTGIAQPGSAVPAGRRDDLVLTYDNSVNTDGVGAQLQRIYGIYAISRLLGVSYLHSPIDRVDYQGLAALEQNSPDPDFHREFNDLFQIASDVPPESTFRELHVPNISPAIFRRIVALRDRDERGAPPRLMRLAVPYGIADRFPDCYAACKEISPFAAPARDGSPLRVALHVRRGELLALESFRMLPNSYYVAVARNVARTLDALGFDFEIELWTEVPEREFIVAPNDHGIANRIGAPVAIGPQMCRLEDFGVLPNLVRHVNSTSIDCIRGLATADVLVMSKSSFSYLGGILNRSGVVLYHPFWHAAPSSWVTVDPDGQLDRKELSLAVRALATDRAGR